MEDAFEQSLKLFRLYLKSDTVTARKLLKQEIELLESISSPNSEKRRATVLFLECARLYVLELKSGNTDAAQLALIKANYWNLRRYELDANHGNMKLEEFKTITPEKIVEVIESSDRYYKDSVGPRHSKER